MRMHVVGVVAAAPSVTTQAYAVNFYNSLKEPGDVLVVSTGAAAVRVKLKKFEYRKNTSVASGDLIAGADDAVTGGVGMIMLALAANTSETIVLDRLVDYVEATYSANVSATGVYFTLMRGVDDRGNDLLSNKIGGI